MVTIDLFLLADAKQCFIHRVTLEYGKFFDMLNNTPVYRFLKKNMMVALRQHGDGVKHLEEMSTMHIKELLDKMGRGMQKGP